jgi:hypothetical protein
MSPTQRTVAELISLSCRVCLSPGCCGTCFVLTREYHQLLTIAIERGRATPLACLDFPTYATDPRFSPSLRAALSAANLPAEAGLALRSPQGGSGGASA